MNLQDYPGINGQLIKMAQDGISGLLSKAAFIPAGDPSGGGAAGGGGDPAAAAGGGGDPAAMDPAAMDPAASGGSGGSGGMDMAALQPMIQQAVQQAMMQQGGGAGGAGGGGALKPKVDVNVVLTQVVKLLARICDNLGIKVPASEMIVGQPDLMGMAQATQTGGALPGMDPTAQAGGAAGGAGGGAIGPMQGMEGMQPAGVPGGGGAPKTAAHRNGNGVTYSSVIDKADAVSSYLKTLRSNR